VTGSYGYIGSNLAWFLEDKGFQVIDYNLEDGQDILDVEALEQSLKDCDFVYNCAAIAGLNECEEDHKKAFETNVVGSQNIVELSEDYGCKPILFGSFAVDGDSYYGYTKRVMEERYKDRAVILRCSNVYGGINYKELKLNSFISRISNDNPIQVFDKTQTRDFVHINTVLEWCIKAQELPFGVYKVCTGFQVPIDMVAWIVGTVRNTNVIYTSPSYRMSREEYVKSKVDGKQ